MTSATSTSGGGGGATAFFSSWHPAKLNAAARTIIIKTDLPFTLPPLLPALFELRSKINPFHTPAGVDNQYPLIVTGSPHFKIPNMYFTLTLQNFVYDSLQDQAAC
jgi:hypothetical protein